jgi:hypothetical protein
MLKERNFHYNQKRVHRQRIKKIIGHEEASFISPRTNNSSSSSTSAGPSAGLSAGSSVISSGGGKF